MTVQVIDTAIVNLKQCSNPKIKFQQALEDPDIQVLDVTYVVVSTPLDIIVSQASGCS